jgi:ABC-type nitrate/sulfonate/bicarbonate transport system substrate-binding protein
MKLNRAKFFRSTEALRVGFMPGSACAPLVYAKEYGLFAKYGLDVELSREASWAHIRDKVINGDLDAAQAPATLPFLANLGLDSDPCSCVSAMVLNLQGSAITISRQLWREGVCDLPTLREYIHERWGKHTLTIGAGFAYSPEAFLLRDWLASGGIDPESHVRLVPVPPEQMFAVLKLGYLDAFCGCEPWNSVAVEAGTGICLATGGELAPRYPETVLIVRHSFATGQSSQHERLVAALLEACAACDLPETRMLLCDLLAAGQYVNAPPEALKAGLVGPFHLGQARIGNVLDLAVFHQNEANAPTAQKAAWIIDHLYQLLTTRSPQRRPYERAPILKNIFRLDAFERARTLVREHSQDAPTEGAQTAVAWGPPLASSVES